MTVCAIIPARGGSKGIPKKNIIPLKGKPLLVYSIEYALNDPMIEKVVVSTDDLEIASIASANGAEVPFLRPSELAQDDSPDWPVFVHTLKWLGQNEGYVPSYVVHLRPTSPIREPGLVARALELFSQHPDADSAKTVCDPHQSPFRMWREQDEYLRPLMEEKYYMPSPAPRQQLPPVYWQTASVDVIKYTTIMEKGSMTGHRILPLITRDRRHMVDVDDAFDVKMIEWLMEEFPENRG